MEVANFYGYSIGIGVIVSVLIEAIKFTQAVPFIGHWHPVKFVVDSITKGNPMQIRIGVAVFCTLLNLISFFVNGGSATDVFALLTMVGANFNSFLAALGTFNLIFEPVEKLAKPKDEQ